MLFKRVWFAGATTDVRVEGGRIAAIGELDGPADVTGGTLTGSFAEPHVHLDAALLGRRAPNLSGTLVEGIRNWATLRDDLTADDIRDRALETIRWYVGFGCTRLRTHVDTGSLLAVEALLALREEVKHGVPGLTAGGAPVPVTLQVVAFPQEGILRAPGRQQQWETAVRMGCDAVGAIPHFERTADEGWKSLRMALDLAEAVDAQVDVHCDETDDPGSRHLEVLCAEAIDRGYGSRIVAGHCTALHSYPEPHAAKVITLVAESDVQVVCNPLDNIVLQGRYGGYPKVRGLTRVDELRAAGATVGIGHDSVMDPWYGLGTANLVDAAYMLIHAGHLTGHAQMLDVMAMLSGSNHRPFGGPPDRGVGGPADLVWFPADDPIEVVRLRPRPRVFVGGAEVVTG